MGLEARIWAFRLGFAPQGWGLGFKAGIWTSRLGFGPPGWDLGLEAGIWAERWGRAGTKKEEEKFLHM